MASVIPANSNLMTFNAVGAAPSHVLSALQGQWAHFGDIHNLVGNPLASMIKSVASAFDNQHGESFRRLLNYSANTLSRWMGSDTIGYRSDTHQLRTSPVVMQQYIMAHVGFRELYHQNLIDGYSDTYVDTQPTAVGDTHYHYQKAMDGLMQYDPETGEEWYSHYPEHMADGDQPLLVEEQVDIQSTWKFLDYLKSTYYRKEFVDPTDIYRR